MSLLLPATTPPSSSGRSSSSAAGAAEEAAAEAEEAEEAGALDSRGGGVREIPEGIRQAMLISGVLSARDAATVNLLTSNRLVPGGPPQRLVPPPILQGLFRSERVARAWREAAASPDVNAWEAHDGHTLLSRAAAGKCPHVVQALLRFPRVDVNAPARNGFTALMTAAETGSAESVRALLAAPGIDLGAQNYAGVQALAVAAGSGRLPAVNALLAAPGIHVNAVDALGQGRTALGEAAERGHLEVVRALLASGASVHSVVPPAQSTPALTRAARNNHAGVLRALLAVPGIDVNARGERGCTALTEAACYGRTEAVRVLLAAPDTDPHAADMHGYTALYQAARHNRPDVVRALLSSVRWYEPDTLHAALMHTVVYGSSSSAAVLLSAPGCDINAHNGIALAAAVGRPDMVKLFLDAGADANAAYAPGIYPLAEAVNRASAASVSLLLGAGAHVREADRVQWSAKLHAAVAAGYYRMLQTLLSIPGLHVNAAGDAGETILHTAVRKDDLGMVELILTAPGLDVNATSANGETALMYAAAHGLTGVAKALLASLRISVDAKRGGTEAGGTALHAAAASNHHAILHALLTSGADASAQDGLGRTALMLAALRGHEESLQLLLVWSVKKSSLPGT